MSIQILGSEIFPSETNMMQDKVRNKISKIDTLENWRVIYLMRVRAMTTELISYFYEKSHDKKYRHYWTSNMNVYLALSGLTNMAVKNRSFLLLCIFFHNNYENEKISLHLMGEPVIQSLIKLHRWMRSILCFLAPMTVCVC